MTSVEWTNSNFIPYPATWLNAAGWRDEIQTPYTEAELAVIERFNDALGAPRMIREVMSDFIESVAPRAGGLQTAIATGIEGIDRLLNGGMRPGQLVIVAGRPSMGNTALSTDIGLNMSSAVSVLNFSMEMESQEIAARALANRGRVDLAQLMGRINENDTDTWNRVTHGTIVLRDLTFAIDDTAAISLLELCLKAKPRKRKHGLDTIIVDYLGLMTGGDGDKRHEQIGSYSRGLKDLAKEMGVVVIALAQLNRKVEERPDRRHMLSDLRDSGEIEQDADTVMLVRRPEMYELENHELKGFAEVLVRKHRSGSLGDIPLNFDGPTCRFQLGSAPPRTQHRRGIEGRIGMGKSCFMWSRKWRDTSKQSAPVPTGYSNDYGSPAHPIGRGNDSM